MLHFRPRPTSIINASFRGEPVVSELLSPISAGRFASLPNESALRSCRCLRSTLVKQFILSCLLRVWLSMCKPNRAQYLEGGDVGWHLAGRLMNSAKELVEFASGCPAETAVVLSRFSYERKTGLPRQDRTNGRKWTKRCSRTHRIGKADMLCHLAKRNADHPAPSRDPPLWSDVHDTDR